MDFSELHNYYEPIVYQYVAEVYAPEKGLDDEEVLKDIACLALNLLPARYVRHDVDMAFFLTSHERDHIHDAVIDAVAEAHQRIETADRNLDEAS